MIPDIEVTREILENIDPSDIMIPTDTIKAINETALDQLADYRDTNRESQADPETDRAIIMTALAHQVVFCFGDRRPRWSNEYTRTNPSLRNMSCIGCGS